MLFNERGKGWKGQVFERLVLDCATMENLDGFYDDFSKAFKFPDYFSRNLDSLDEIVNDEDLIGERKICVQFLSSQKFLSEESERNRRCVIDLLSEMKNIWNKPGNNVGQDSKNFGNLVFVFDGPMSELAMRLKE